MSNLLIKPLSEFTYEDLLELKGIITSYEFALQERKVWPTYSAKLKWKSLKNKEARDRQIERDKSNEKYIKAFVDKYVAPGNLLKLKGTKGSNVREVVKVTGESVIGLVVERRVKNKNGDRMYTGYSSENSIYNILEFNDEFDFWRDKKWIIEKGKELLNES